MEDIETAKKYFLTALAAYEANNFEYAAQLLRQALKITPERVSVLVNLAATLLRLKHPEEARRHAARSVEIDPHNLDGWLNLGHADSSLRRHEEAAASFAEALKIDPHSAEAWTYQGNALTDLHRYQAALDCHDKAITLRAGYADAWCNRGNALHGLGKHQEAIDCYEHAIEIKADFAVAWSNRGNALRDLKLKQQACESYDRAIALQPGFALAHSRRGKLFTTISEREKALDDLSRASALTPESAIYRLQHLIAQIPVISRDIGEIMASRAVFAAEAVSLEKWLDAANPPDGVDAVGASQPFFLAYQPKNNRDLLKTYGEICVKLMRSCQIKINTPPRIGPKLRLGIVSTHISDNSVWNAFVKGWFQRLDRNIFEIHVFHLGDKYDDDTDFARRCSSSFHHGVKSLENWVELISESGIQVQIFPEVGMDALTVKLASLRLAPVQVAAWGHPETTGLPTIDYYLSADDFEVQESQNGYTEKLVALPNLGCYYGQLETPATNKDLQSLGVTAGHTLMVCAGTPFKYSPEHDQVFVEIARRVGEVQFLFFTFHEEPLLSERLFDRLAAVFRRGGLDFSEFAVVAPWQTRADFYSILKQADVFLDTIGFSGFNTAMQAVECGLPVVTCEGAFMRGRFASAILRRIGLQELVADDDLAYVECAVKLAQCKPYRETIRATMTKNRHVLYNDEAPIAALQNFLIDASLRVTQR